MGKKKCEDLSHRREKQQTRRCLKSYSKLKHILETPLYVPKNGKIPKMQTAKAGEDAEQPERSFTASEAAGQNSPLGR